MTEIVALAYCSRPVDFSFEQTEQILTASRRNNAKAGLTGALIYDNHTFLQWIEGEATEIREVFERISNDPRHTDIKLMLVRKLDDRWFPDWSMTAAVTQDQTLRSLKLVPHLSLSRFDPYGWSEADAISFMDALSDYLNRRPTPKSKGAEEPVTPRAVESNPMTRLDRHLDKLL
ncbi:BLUF domain-containing protein [Sediminimonas qiaohouensis]|uniref:BLUF domain-containing protein n=1 Tax=Sediminimonas qiaohouensis TaxID=552061 RepID=UPI00041B4B74|nr:BLUF domain-containing protein [Sediminimonas qiaohouensis]